MPKENSPIFFVKSEVNDNWYKSLSDYEITRYNQKELVAVKGSKLQSIFSKKSHIKSNIYGVDFIASLNGRSKSIKQSFAKNLAKVFVEDQGIWLLGLANENVNKNISNIENSCNPDNNKELSETLVKTKQLIEKSHHILINPSHINKYKILEDEFLLAEDEVLVTLAKEANLCNRFNEAANHIVMECSNDMNIKSFQVGRSMFIKRDFIR